MRERTTWNRTQIKQAAQNKTADPYTMNQDHVNQQPKADDYVTGTPSDFAEDVNKENRWEAEYSGGAVKRDEIGMPEKRPETYNHPEKTASEAVLMKKAELTVKVARMMLPKTASEAAVEDQAYGLMYLPDAELINTFDRLANEGEFPGGQFPATAQEQTPPPPPPAQQAADPQAPVGSANLEAMVQTMVQQAMKQQSCNQQACKQATDDADKKQSQDEPKKDEPKEQQAKQAADLEAMVQSMVQNALKQQAQGQPQQPAQDQTQQAQQVAPPAQPAPQQQQAQPQEQGLVSDDQLLDNMLMGDPMMDDMGMGIEMEAPSMDTGDVVLGPEDDVLRTLFANQETQDAEQAQQAQEGGQDKQEKQAGMARTASTRTVGTRPTQGVSRVGGAAAAAPAGGNAEVNKLSALWPTAPDVREAFGINK